MHGDDIALTSKRMLQMTTALCMAKILFSGVAGVDMRNKLNGSVFSKNRYGGYVRTKVTPVNPQTTAQQAARNRLSTNSQAWRGLTEDQRQSWIDGAINFPFTDLYGNTKTLSGQALFVKINNNLNVVGSTAIVTCPSPEALPALNSIALTAAAGGPTLSLAFDPSPQAVGFKLIVEATGNVTPGKSFVKNLFRFIGLVNAGDTTPADILSMFQAVHGDPIEAQKIFVRVRMADIATGQVGIPLQTLAIVAP